MGFAQEIDHLFDGELLERLAETSEGFVEFDRGVLHVIMGAFRAAHDQKVLGPGDSMLAVAVQPHAEKTDDLTLGLFRFLFRLLSDSLDTGQAPFPQKVRHDLYQL